MMNANDCGRNLAAILQYLPGRAEKKNQKSSVQMADIFAEIQTWDSPNMKWKS
jgi:hypothetical protein